MPSSTLRPEWSSSLAFYLATVGASVGLGSIRRSINVDELSETTPLGRKMLGWLLSYLCPLAIAAVCAANLF